MGANKMVGGGGANTNANGLKFEQDTDLMTDATCKGEINKWADEVFFGEGLFTVPKKKTGLFNLIKPSLPKDQQAHGCKQPDECYIRDSDKVIFILEKKYQQCSGSVCEKLQTAVFKQDHMRELFPSHRVVYFYCLSDWFKENAKAELKFLEKNAIKVFWGSDPEYKEKVVSYLNSY